MYLRKWAEQSKLMSSIFLIGEDSANLVHLLQKETWRTFPRNQSFGKASKTREKKEYPKQENGSPAKKSDAAERGQRGCHGKRPVRRSGEQWPRCDTQLWRDVTRAMCYNVTGTTWCIVKRIICDIVTCNTAQRIWRNVTYRQLNQMKLWQNSSNIQIIFVVVEWYARNIYAIV